MKKPEDEILGDLLKLGQGALAALMGAAATLGGELESKRDTIVRKLDLVTREEFDVAFAMIKKARATQESLEARLTAIEKKLKMSTPRKTPRAKQNRRKS